MENQEKSHLKVQISDIRFLAVLHLNRSSKMENQEKSQISNIKTQNRSSKMENQEKSQISDF